MTTPTDRARAYLAAATTAYSTATPAPGGFVIDEFPGASLHLPDLVALVAEIDQLRATSTEATTLDLVEPSETTWSGDDTWGTVRNMPPSPPPALAAASNHIADLVRHVIGSPTGYLPWSVRYGIAYAVLGAGYRIPPNTSTSHSDQSQDDRMTHLNGSYADLTITSNTTLNGAATGNVTVQSGEANIDGRVGGSVIANGGLTTIRGTVGSITRAGGGVRIAVGAVVGGRVLQEDGTWLKPTGSMEIFVTPDSRLYPADDVL